MMTAATNDGGATSHLGVTPPNSDQPPGRTGVGDRRTAAIESRVSAMPEPAPCILLTEPGNERLAPIDMDGLLSYSSAPPPPNQHCRRLNQCFLMTSEIWCSIDLAQASTGGNELIFRQRCELN